MLLLLLVLPLASGAQALEVRDTLWGFDGKVVPGRFNPVSILLENPTSSASDVMLLLHRTDGLGRRAGEEVAEPCFLAPFAARWVQFEVYIRDDNEPWLLTWRDGSKELPPPRLGPPASILLADPESVGTAGAGLKRLPEGLFPPSAAATEALNSVVLDHVPHWEAARRQAFMDWLWAGGTVRLGRDRTGNFPVFPEDMSALNAPGERVRVGAGQVVRRAASSAQISENFLPAADSPMPELKFSPTAETGDAEDLFFSILRNMTRPTHNWALIYGLIGAYAVLIVPVNFLLGRMWRDYRRTMAFCLATVVCFGWLFSVVGRRGYGESAAVHTLSYARPLGPGAWDVTQWSNVFVIDGAYYTLTHPCPHNVYSTCAQMETVNGAVQNGREGNFRVDIPLYSSRAFLHRGRFTGPDLHLKVVEWREGHASAPEGTERLESFAVEGAIPEGLAEAHVFYRGAFYPAEAVGGRIQMTGGAAQTTEQFFPRGEMRNLMYAGRYRQLGPEAPRTDEQFKQLLRPLLARAVGGAGVFRHELVLPQADDAVQLFLFARAPESFSTTKSGLGRETGYVLYHFTLFKPET